MYNLRTVTKYFLVKHTWRHGGGGGGDGGDAAAAVAASGGAIGDGDADRYRN